MAKSATDVMREVMFSAVIDAIAAMKVSAKGMPNILLRDINAIHANSTFDDLPKETQAAISSSVWTAFNRLRKEGFEVGGAVAPTRSGPAPVKKHVDLTRRSGTPNRGPNRNV